MTSATDPLDELVSRVDFLLAGVHEGSIEVDHALYRRLLGHNYGRTAAE